MDYENITFKVEDDVGILTINRPKKMNALNSATMDEIQDAVASVKSGGNVRVLIITGAGEKAFVAGADISEFVNIGLKEGFDFTRKGHQIFGAIENLGIPSIAAVNGLALGGGCELAMACTFRIVAEGAKIGLPELGLGVIPGYGGTQRLARLIGKGRALWVMLTGDMIDSQEAFRIGWANMVVKPDELMDTCMKVANKIKQKGPLAVKYALTAVNYGSEAELETGLIIESLLTNLALSSKDKEEGVASFMEKRKPVFRGE